MASSRLLKALAATAELCGRVFTDSSVTVLAGDLSAFDEEAVLRALTRCRKEVKGVLTTQDIISRIDDGRPGVEEAWAMLPMSEDQSVVWNDEIAEAWGIAKPLMDDGDRIAARMAFKEAYARLITKAREEGKKPCWTPSLGRDVAARQMALADAVRQYRLPLSHAVDLLPGHQAEGLLMTLGVKNHPLLAAPNKEGQTKVRELLLTLKGKAV